MTRRWNLDLVDLDLDLDLVPPMPVLLLMERLLIGVLPAPLVAVVVVVVVPGAAGGVLPSIPLAHPLPWVPPDPTAWHVTAWHPHTSGSTAWRHTIRLTSHHPTAPRARLPRRDSIDWSRRPLLRPAG